MLRSDLTSRMEHILLINSCGVIGLDMLTSLGQPTIRTRGYQWNTAYYLNSYGVINLDMLTSLGQPAIRL